MSDSKQRKIGAVLSYIIIFLNLLVALIYTPILTGKLGQSEYGLYSLVTSVISYLMLLDFGFGNAIVIFSTRYKKKNDKIGEEKLYGTFALLYLITGIVALILGIIIYFNIGNIFKNSLDVIEIILARKLMIILIINLVITFAFSIYNSIITSYEKFIYAKIVNIIRIIITPCIMIPLLYFGFRSIALCIVLTILNIACNVSNYIFCKKKLKISIKKCKLNKLLIIEIFSLSFWMFLNSFVDKINWSLDNFLLGTITGTVSVSIYSIASQINQIYISFSTAISGVLLPKVTKMIDNGCSDDDLTNMMIRTGRIQLIVVGLILSGFIIFGEKFILYWVGKKYYESYFIALALMIPVIIPLVQNVGISIMQAKKKQKFMSIILFLSSILNVIISIPLIKLYSGLGAAIGTSLSLILCNVIIRNIYYQKSLNLNMIKFFKKIGKMFIIIILITIGALIFKQYLLVDSGFIFILYIIIYSIIYFLLLYFLEFNSYEKKYVKLLLDKIKMITSKK